MSTFINQHASITNMDVTYTQGAVFLPQVRARISKRTTLENDKLLVL